MSMHKSARNDTSTPAGQVVNFEKPLGKHIQDFMTQREADLVADNMAKTAQIDAQALEIERLRGRVLELEQELESWNGPVGMC